jgi:hypothetical protein
MRHVMYYSFAIVVIALYLLLPVKVFACCDAPGVCKAGAQIVRASGEAPCGSPCSGTPHADCCESSCCCPCHAPLGQRVTVAYTPMVTFRRCLEIRGKLPQVYPSIYVPPQNRTA